MRKLLLTAVICSLASAVFAATGQFKPLDVKTGAWQMTATSTINATIPPAMLTMLDRLPPEQRARTEEMLKSRFGGTPQTRTDNVCLTQENLSTNPFSDSGNKCDWTSLSSTGTDLEAHGTCGGGKNNGANTDASFKVHVVNSESVTGEIRFNIAGNGQNMKSDNTFSGKWVGATCAPGTN